MSRLDELLNLKNEYDAKIKRDGESILKEEFQNVFSNDKDLQALRWTQSTPYFNDGDPCVFGVSDIEYLTSKDVIISEGEDENCLDEYEWREDWQDDCHESIKKLNSKMSKLTDCLEAIYGDHVEVVVTRYKIEINDYDHD